MDKVKDELRAALAKATKGAWGMYTPPAIAEIVRMVPALLDHIDALEAGREGDRVALRLIDSDAYGTRPAPDGHEPGEYLAALAGHHQGRIAWCRAIAREALAKPKEG